jgi:predicted amidohydrolase YtcJ
MTATLFTGGTIITLASSGEVEALAVVEGRIRHAGTLDDCRGALRGVEHREVDLAGHALMPGFVDAHTHPVMYGMCATWADVSPAQVASIDDLVDTLREQARQLAPSEPVRGFGYHQEHLAERRHPTVDDLDRVAAERPVLVMHTSGHGYVVNSWLLKTLGIGRTTSSPPGGDIGRDEHGEPDGRLWDAACDLLTGVDGIKVTNHGPNFHLPEAPDQVAASLEVAQTALLRAGITTVADAQVTGKEFAAYLSARRDGTLRLRVHALLLSSLLPQLEALGIAASFGDERLRLLGVKLYADGSLTAGTAYVPGGYADPCHNGHRYHEPQDLRELLTRAHVLGLQTGTHAQGPEAIGYVLDAVEHAQGHVPRRDARHRIEHCGLPTRAQVRRMRELGVVPVGQPQHVSCYGDGVLEAVGELGRRFTPFGWFRDAGVPVVLSSDTPVVRPEPFSAVAAAVSRRTGRGTQMGGEDLRVTVEDALRGYTLGGAYAIHR